MKLVVKAPEWYCNLPVTEIKREEDLIFAYRDGQLIGVFDIGAVAALWVSEENYR